MKLYDKNKIVEIKMFDDENGVDFSKDFFDAGCLKYDPELDAYRVKDVDYCKCQAFDWVNAEGDFQGDKEYCDISNREFAYEVVGQISDGKIHE